MNKKVIYSAVVGNYDTVKQPQVIHPEYDYILFSNTVKEDYVGVWQIRCIDYSNLDNTRIARYVKTHPIELLPEYETSVWMDSNICICTDYIYKRVEELIERYVVISTIQHNRRDCIYDEAFVIINYAYDKESIVIRQMNYLVKNGYERNLGLCETGVLFRKHTPEVDYFNKEWWSLIDKYSKRDQLSFNYVLWKTKLNFEYLLPEGKSVRNVVDFKYAKHQKDTNLRKYNTYEAWIMRYYHKRSDCIQKTKKIYWWIYNRKFPLFWSFVIGQYLRVSDLIETYIRGVERKYIR